MKLRFLALVYFLSLSRNTVSIILNFIDREVVASNREFVFRRVVREPVGTLIAFLVLPERLERIALVRSDDSFRLSLGLMTAVAAVLSPVEVWVVVARILIERVDSIIVSVVVVLR